MKQKINSALLYPVLLIILAACVVIYTQYESAPAAKENPVSSGMPHDDIHKSIPPGVDAPSKNNVTENFTHQLNMLKEAVAKDPGDTLRVRQLADLLAAGHKGEEAIPLYRSILKKDSKRIDILFSLSQIYYLKSDFSETEKLTNDVLKIEPANLQALYNLGAIAATKGDKEKARLHWEKLVQKYPNTEIGKMAAENINKL